MGTEADPVVERWYRHLDKGETFQVVALDADAGVIGIEYFDGDLDEVALEDWYGLEIEPCEPPEDWTGPVDDVERDDLGYSETAMTGRDWHEDAADQPALKPRGEEPELPAEQDEWEEGSPESPDEGEP